MLLLDRHESLELGTLFSQVTDCETDQPLNDQGLPDAFWLDNKGRMVGVEFKQGGELLGSLESVEDQLMREMAHVDYLALAIRGVITSHKDGSCQTWRHPVDKLGNVNTNLYVKGKVYQVAYKGLRAWLARLQEAGVLVLEAPDARSLVMAVVALYENSLKSEVEHRTFRRLIVTKQWLNELDPDKARFAKQLMACVPGCGEEIALTLADYFPSLKTLMDTLEGGGEEKVAGLKLRGGKRSIGPSVVMRMKGALGI